MKNAHFFKLSKWKVVAFSVVVLVCAGAIGVYRFINPDADPPPDADPDNSSYHLTKTVIQAGMRDLDKAYLSPDGSTVLIDRRETKQDLSEPHWLEFHDVASFRTFATMPLPTAPPPPPSRPKTELVSKAVHFCNGGKIILLYEGGYSLAVIDARTYTQKSSIMLTETVNRSAQNPLPDDNPTVVLACGCAADAPVGAVELVFGPFGTGVTKVFDLDNGQQVSEIAIDLFGYPRNIDISPSGASAAILVTKFQREDLRRPDDAAKYSGDLAILDMKTRSLRRRIQTSQDVSHVAFAGEDEVAVISSGDGNEQNQAIELFDVHSGAVSQRFGDVADGARAFVAASADGSSLLGYTGKEWMYREGMGNYLQIDKARFTIWDRRTGKVMAQSPGLQVFTASYKMLDNSHTISQRPTIDYSQHGNAALVSWPGLSTKRLEVFSIK